MAQMRNEFDSILKEIESGIADTNTAERLRKITNRLFECPNCSILTDNLYGHWQVCCDCQRMIADKLREEED